MKRENEQSFLSRQITLRYLIKNKFSHLQTFQNTFQKHFITLLRTDTRVIIKQKNFSKHKNTKAIFKNEHVPKSPQITKDRKGANTFHFYNLPPVLIISRKNVISVLFPFPRLDEIKVGGDSCNRLHQQCSRLHAKSVANFNRVQSIAPTM